jgi:hypothetical protein
MAMIDTRWLHQTEVRLYVKEQEGRLIGPRWPALSKGRLPRLLRAAVGR